MNKTFFFFGQRLLWPRFVCIYLSISEQSSSCTYFVLTVEMRWMPAMFATLLFIKIAVVMKLICLSSIVWRSEVSSSWVSTYNPHHPAPVPCLFVWATNVAEIKFKEIKMCTSWSLIWWPCQDWQTRQKGRVCCGINVDKILRVLRNHIYCRELPWNKHILNLDWSVYFFSIGRFFLWLMYLCGFLYCF